MALADQRVADLRTNGVPAYVYGKEEIVGGLNCFFLLVDEPEVYGLPSKPRLPSEHVDEGFALSGLAAAAVAVGSVVAFRKERMDGMNGDGGGPGADPAGPPDDATAERRPAGSDTVAFMHAVHGANEASRARRAPPVPAPAATGCGGGGCGSACGCHA
jgi:formate dehydrogenase iron-sulfur subunit